jgi:uncharacterized membrane protein (DUF441 family)
MQALFTTAFESLSTIELAGGAFAIGSTILGLFISYLAYRGLRRHDSRPMQFLAVGMMLLFGVAYAVALLGQSLISMYYLPLYYQDVFRLLVRILQFSGLVCITYSLWTASQSNATTRIDPAD